MMQGEKERYGLEWGGGVKVRDRVQVIARERKKERKKVLDVEVQFSSENS